MTEAIRQWILNIVSLIVFITVVEVIIPSGKFKKYIHLVTGTVVVIAIITPLTGLAGKDFSFPEFQLKNTAAIEKSEFDKQKNQIQESQAKQIAEAYKKKLSDQIMVQVMQTSGIKEKGRCQVDVAINEDYGSDRFGEILQVKVYLLQDSKAVSGTLETNTAAAGSSGAAANLNADKNSSADKNANSASSAETQKIKSVNIDPVVIGKQDSNSQAKKTPVNGVSNTQSSNTEDKTGKIVKSKVSALLSIPEELVYVNEQ